MRGGSLRHELVIQALANSSTDLDTRGQTSTPSWRKVATVRASIQQLSTNQVNARQQYPSVTHRIRCRYVPGVNAKCRAIFGSRTLQFQSVINIEEKSRELEILAGEEVA
jgi:SPP1 family predicted phage head-tail adaptor